MVNHLSAIPLAAALLVALAGPGRAVAGPAEDRAAAQAELAALAPRIELLKREAAAGRGGGPELERLLGRAQALAAQLERPAAAPAPAPSPGPDAQELRERADALRDRADKEAALLAEVERRLTELRRRAELAEGLDALGATSGLFADSAAFRPGPAGSRPGDTSTPPGSTGGTGTPATGGTGTGAAGGLVAPAPVLRSAAEPGAGGGAALPEDATALRRRRGELARSLATLRAQAAALDAEAVAAEGR